MMYILHMLLILCGVMGIGIAYHIYGKKRVQEAPVCPLNFKCETVIYSPYSTFLGIPVEKLGVIYYIFISAAYTSMWSFPNLVTAELTLFAFSATIAAFLFSLYLTAIQSFVLKEFCTWCLASAAVCTIIFALAAATSRFSFTELLRVLN
ncbi:MAG: vitamin K epoxide reductase family protein [Candidatus Taylorbacteria bacterium]|nr:vitamin K epoxide reductase family protein [Candidatus Taylorbacteria bacterium]